METKIQENIGMFQYAWKNEANDETVYAPVEAYTDGKTLLFVPSKVIFSGVDAPAVLPGFKHLASGRNLGDCLRQTEMQDILDSFI
jgi:hypothetical protein